MATEKAKLIASAVRGGTVFVYAASSKDPVLAAQNAHKTLNKMAASAFKCSDCGNKQHVVASVTPEPYCVSCGSDRVIESNGAIPATAAFVSDAELASVTCSSCNTDNVFPVKAVRVSAGHLHCVTCGTELSIAEGEDREDVDFAPNPDAAPVDLSGEDDFPAGDDATGLEVSSDMEDDDGSFTEESDSSDGMDDIALENSSMDDLEESEESPMLEGADVMDADMPNFGQGDLASDAEEPTYLKDPVADSVDSGEPMIDALELNDSPDGLEFVSRAGLLIARKGVHTVAFARASDVGTNADIMHTPSFAKAVTITAQRIGVRKALARMGFKDVTVKPVDSKATAREVSKAKGQFEAIQASKQRVFADSLAIAAVGMAKGLFKGFQDPVRAAVEAALATSMGPRGAKVTASRIMATNGIDYAKGLLQLANKLSGMTEVARKEYSEMLDLVDDTELSNSDEMLNNESAADLDGNGVEDVTDVSEDLDSVQSRLTTTAVLLRPKNAVTSSTRRASSPSNSAAAILAGTAPLRFGV